MFGRIFNSVLSIVFPPLCISCGRILGGFGSKVCDACWGKLRKLPSFVIENKIYTDHLDMLVAVYIFDEVFQKIVHMIKYSGFRSVAYELGYRAGKELRRMPRVLECEVIIPVPLNPVKKRERGYNQSEILARGFSASVGVPVEVGFLVRRKYTVSQTNLGVEERKKNVEDAFCISRYQKSFKGRSVILLDDVVTTGATLNYAAKALRSAGVKEVIGIAVATPLMD